MSNVKTVEHDCKVYVGDYDAGLMWNPLCVPPSTMNPINFYEYANQLRQNVYSNNMDLVRFYRAEQVIVVKKENYKTYMKCLTEHPKYEHWKEEMDAGEFASLVGFDWVID
jgi:hypothetical protein